MTVPFATIAQHAMALVRSAPPATADTAVNALNARHVTTALVASTGIDLCAVNVMTALVASMVSALLVPNAKSVLADSMVSAPHVTNAVRRVRGKTVAPFASVAAADIPPATKVR